MGGKKMDRWPGWKIEVEVECESGPTLYGYESWHETEFYIVPDVADLAGRGKEILESVADLVYEFPNEALKEKTLSYIAELEQIAGK